VWKPKEKITLTKIKLSLVSILTFDYVSWDYCSIEDNISKRFDRHDSLVSKIDRDSSKMASFSMWLRFVDRFDGNFASWFTITISESWSVESVFRFCAIFEYTSKDCSLDTDLIFFQTMIHPNPCREKMLRNWTGFGLFDKESKLNQVLLDFLAHQIWSGLKIITAIISSHEPSLQNENWTESV